MDGGPAKSYDPTEEAERYADVQTTGHICKKIGNNSAEYRRGVENGEEVEA